MNYFLGIELNGSLLKIAAFKKSRQYLELIKLDRLNLPSDSSEATKEITQWINRNLPDVSSIKAVVTLSESVLYIKDVEFPKMTPEKLNEAIYWEIPSIAPIPQTDSVYDWKITSEQKGMSNVLVIVGKSSFVQNIISIFRNAQIEVIAIEPSSLAFARVANAPFDSNTLICLVQEQGMDFVILKYGIPFFTTSTTGNTQYEKLSRIKSGNDLTVEIVSEGKKIINYWENKESSKIQQVVVSGDLVYKYFGLSASLNLFPPITTYVGTIKRIKYFRANEYNELSLVGYLISIGAGLRNFQKDPLDGINLFPSSEKQKNEKIRIQKKITSNLLTFIYTNTFILFLVGASILALNIWQYSLDIQYKTLNEKLSTNESYKQISEIKDINQSIDNNLTLFKNQDDVGNKLKILASLAPQSIKLTSVNLVFNKNQEWTIEGVGDRNSILAYQKNLAENSNAKNVRMLYSNLNKPLDNEFTILLTW